MQMDFYHIPSFEDNFTMNIWLKNWNLRVNKSFFTFINIFNSLLNRRVSFQEIRRTLSPELQENLFPFHKWLDENMQFHVYVKDNHETSQENFAQFFMKMHFILFVVQVEETDDQKILEIQNSLKKFVLMANITSVITFAFCKTKQARKAFSEFSNCVVLTDPAELDETVFCEKFVPLFLKTLQEKLVDIPALEKEQITMDPETFKLMLKKRPVNISNGKVMKLRGDVSFIFNSLIDSQNYYKKALDIFLNDKKTQSKGSEVVNLWIAGIYESIAACIYYKIKKVLIKDPRGGPEIRAEVAEIDKLVGESLKIFQQERKMLLYHQLLLKMIDLCSVTGNRAKFIEIFFKLRVLYLATPLEQSVFLHIGDLAHRTKLDRIAICALFEYSKQAKQTEKLESVRRVSLNLCAKILNLDLENYYNNFEMVDKLPSKVTEVILINLLEINNNCQNNLKRLHYYLLLLKKFDANDWVFNEITKVIHWEYPIYESEYDILPFIQRVVPVGKPKLFKSIESGESGMDIKGVSESVFIYDPRKKNRFVDLNWIAQEQAEIILYFTNPLEKYISIDSISLETDNVDVANYSNQINLRPKVQNFEYKFKIRPVQAGLLKIKGVKIRIGNLIYLNTVDQRGISNIYKYTKRENPYFYERHYLSNEVNLFKIPIAESVPNTSIEVRNYVPETIFYNENLVIEYRMTNLSKICAKRPKLYFRIDYENAFTVNWEHELSGFELESNHFFDISFTLNQGQMCNKESEFEVRKIGPDKFGISFANKLIHERVYKITLKLETLFDSNKAYTGVRELSRFFKNYKLFEATTTVVDFYGLNSLSADGKFKYIDISDEVQLFYQIDMKFANVAFQNIEIELVDKETGRDVDRINFAEKNVVKVVHSKAELGAVANLSQKYELVWRIRENNRNGVIQYDFPIVLQVYLLA